MDIMDKDFDAIQSTSENVDFFAQSGVSCDFAVSREGVDWSDGGKKIAKKIDDLWMTSESLIRAAKVKYGCFSGYLLQSDTIIIFNVSGLLLDRLQVAFLNYTDSVSLVNGNFKIAVLSGNYELFSSILINAIEEYLSVATSI